MRMRTCSPALGLALAAAGCFEETGTYDDCARVECSSSDATAESTTATTSVSTTTMPTSSSSTAESGEVESSETSTATNGVDGSSSETSSSDGESSDDATPARCGNGMVEPPEQCEDDSDDDPHDGCQACQFTPQLVWVHREDFLDDLRDDAVLALAAQGDQIQASAVVGSGASFDDAYWFRVGSDTGFPDPSWGYHAILAEHNRVLALGVRGNTCVLGGFVNGFDGVSIAAGNVLDCVDGSITADLQLGAAEAGAGEEAIRALVVRGNGELVVAGVRTHGDAPRAWITELEPGGQTPIATTWLDDPLHYGAASEVNALALAPDDQTVFVAGTWYDGNDPHGFAAPLELATTMPAPFALLEAASVATDVTPIATGMAVAGWFVSDTGDSDARVELFDMDGGAPAEWTLAELGDDRLHGLAPTPDGVVATGFTTDGDTMRDVVVVWLDDGLAEQQRTLWDGGFSGHDVAWDVITTPDGVTIGGTTRGKGAGELFVQRWVLPTP